MNACSLLTNIQRWIYPVDKKRANEFGQVFEDPNATAATEQNTSEIIPETNVLAKKTE